MLDIERRGRGDRLLVLVHGIQGTREAWRTVADLLAGEACLVLPNLRGRGSAARSGAVDGAGAGGVAGYGLDAYADDLVEVIEREVGDRAYLLAGWSLGVSIALQALGRDAALRGPQGLLLVSGTPCLAAARWFDRAAARDDPALDDEIVARRHRLGLRSHADDDAVAATWVAIRDTDQRPLLRRLRVPTMVLHGRDDDDCPLDHGRWLADGLDAPLQVLDGVGHGVLGAAPSQVADALRSLMR